MKRLLVCSDGSNYSRICCQYAAWLGGRIDAEFEILYVTDLRQFEVPLIADIGGSLGIQPYQAVLGQLEELEKKKAEVILNSAKAIFAEAGVDESRVRVTHKTGLLVDCLTDYDASVDLILLGKRGENANFATEHLGSTMERVLRASSRPCLVTSRAFRPITRMLLAYDGGPSCRRALDYLADSSAWRGMELHIVIVAGSIPADAAVKHLQEAESAMRAAGFAPVCQMLHGSPEDQIASYLASNDIQLLAMGAYGHNRIRYLIIGSTTTSMIRTCKVPVLLFR